MFSKPFQEQKAEVLRFPRKLVTPFKGVIHHLREECGGNVHEKGIVRVTTSGCVRYQKGPSIFESEGLWNLSLNPSNGSPWVQFDFETRRVCLRGCNIRYEAGSYIPRYLAIEGSNDGSEWKVIDKRDTRDLDGRYIVKTYDCECNQVKKKYYRYLRLRQTGKNSINDDCLQLSGLEMFGFLR